MAMKTGAVLKALLVESDKALYGLDIYDRTGLLPGTTYPILRRLEDAGLVRSYWEEGDPTDPQQPRRRYYQITHVGVSAARATPSEASGLAAIVRRWFGWRPGLTAQGAASGA